MQQNTKQFEEIKKIDYFESFRTIQALYRLDAELREDILDQGFTLEQVQNLFDIIELDTAMLCFILNITGFDLHKILKQGHFNREMCSRILDIAEIYAYGYYIFQCRRSFNHWMKRDSIMLEYCSPLSLLNTPKGVKEVFSRVKRKGHTLF